MNQASIRARIGELITRTNHYQGEWVRRLQGTFGYKFAGSIALKTFRQDDADIFAAMTPPGEILDLEERGKSSTSTHSHSLGRRTTTLRRRLTIGRGRFSLTVNDRKESLNSLTECLAGGKIPVFINPDLFVGGEVVPRLGNSPEAIRCAFVEF